MEWCKTLKKSFIFAIDLKRWLPVFAADFFFILLVLFAILGGMRNLLGPSMFLEIFVITIPYGLTKIWINGAIVHQSYREGDKVKESFRVSYNKYLSLFAAAIIVGILSGVVSIVPYIGFIFSIIVSLIFFFIYQGIIVKGLKFDETLEHSYNIFRKNWSSVVGIFIVLMIIAGLIMLVFSIPLISIFLYHIGGINTFEGFIQIIISNLALIILTSIIGLIGFSIAHVFNTKAQTEFYLQLTKTKVAIGSKKKVKKTAKRKIRKSK